MSCNDVSHHANSTPFSQWSPGVLVAARDHASTCAKCERTLQAVQRLDADLRGLVAPFSPAPEMVARILKRTGEIASERRPIPAVAARPTVRPKRDLDWVRWAALTTGVTMGLAAQGYRMFAGESSLQVLSWSGLGWPGPIAALSPTPALFAMALGVLLLASGLVARARN